MKPATGATDGRRVVSPSSMSRIERAVLSTYPPYSWRYPTRRSAARSFLIGMFEDEARLVIIAAVFRRGYACVHPAGELLEVGGVRDQSDRTAECIRPEQRPLRTPQDLDTREIDRERMRRADLADLAAARNRDHRRIIEIPRAQWSRLDHAAARDSTKRGAVTTPTVVGVIEPGRTGKPLDDVDGSRLPESLAGESADTESGILQFGRIARRRNDDLLEAPRGWGQHRHAQHAGCYSCVDRAANANSNALRHAHDRYSLSCCEGQPSLMSVASKSSTSTTLRARGSPLIVHCAQVAHPPLGAKLPHELLEARVVVNRDEIRPVQRLGQVTVPGFVVVLEIRDGLVVTAKGSERRRTKRPAPARLIARLVDALEERLCLGQPSRARVGQDQVE